MQEKNAQGQGLIKKKKNFAKMLVFLFIGHYTVHMVQDENSNKTQENTMTLRKIGIIKTKKNVQSIKDRRRIVDCYVVEYRDAANEEYRKSFEIKRGGVPFIPDTGTHEEIHAASEQL